MMYAIAVVLKTCVTYNLVIILFFLVLHPNFFGVTMCDEERFCGTILTYHENSFETFQYSLLGLIASTSKIAPPGSPSTIFPPLQI
jgi:hypothetical protein